jgi:hypothetical protein
VKNQPSESDQPSDGHVIRSWPRVATRGLWTARARNEADPCCCFSRQLDEKLHDLACVFPRKSSWGHEIHLSRGNPSRMIPAERP